MKLKIVAEHQRQLRSQDGVAEIPRNDERVLKVNENRRCFICGSNRHMKNQCDRVSRVEKRFKNNRTDNHRSGGDSHKSFYATLFASRGNTNSDVFYLDSGASTHLVCDEKFLVNKKRHVTDIVLPDGSVRKSECIGEVVITTKNGDR